MRWNILAKLITKTNISKNSGCVLDGFENKHQENDDLPISYTSLHTPCTYPASVTSASAPFANNSILYLSLFFCKTTEEQQVLMVARCKAEQSKAV